MTTTYTRDELTAMNRTQLLELYPTAPAKSTKTKIIELILTDQSQPEEMDEEDQELLAEAQNRLDDPAELEGSVDLSELSEAGPEVKADDAKNEPQVTVETLLERLNTTTDKNAKKKIRAQLRTRGYRLSDVKAQSKVQKAAETETSDDQSDDANDEGDVDLSLNMPEE